MDARQAAERLFGNRKPKSVVIRRDRPVPSGDSRIPTIKGRAPAKKSVDSEEYRWVGIAQREVPRDKTVLNERA
ncbi:MAG: hypothetical protein CMJ59_03890 [Planctomycetaceae bacterium]|nr:hypothetical protein [Planctomycetaceae bacterium]